MTDWETFRDQGVVTGGVYSMPPVPPRRIYPRCMVCSRKDSTVTTYIRVVDGIVAAGRCPTLCADCLEDEPSQDELARKAIG